MQDRIDKKRLQGEDLFEHGEIWTNFNLKNLSVLNTRAAQASSTTCMQINEFWCCNCSWWLIMSNLFVTVYSFRETSHLKRSRGQKRPYID